MKKIDVGTFLDNSIVDIDERLAMWNYDLSSYMHQWDRVLAAKWMLLSIEQGRIESKGE